MQTVNHDTQLSGINWEPSIPPSVSLASSYWDPSAIESSYWPDQANCPVPSSKPIGSSDFIVIFLSISSKTAWELLLLLINLIGRFKLIIKSSSIKSRTSPISSDMIGPFQVDCFIFWNLIDKFCPFRSISFVPFTVEVVPPLSVSIGK